MLLSRDAALLKEEAICSFHIKGQAELLGGFCVATRAFQTAPSTAFFISWQAALLSRLSLPSKDPAKKINCTGGPTSVTRYILENPEKYSFFFLSPFNSFAYFQISFSAHRNYVLAQNDLLYSEVFINT